MLQTRNQNQRCIGPLCEAILKHPPLSPEIQYTRTRSLASLRSLPSPVFQNYSMHSGPLSLPNRSWGECISVVDPLPENSLSKSWSWGRETQSPTESWWNSGLLWQCPFTGLNLPQLKYILQPNVRHRVTFVTRNSKHQLACDMTCYKMSRALLRWTVRNTGHAHSGLNPLWIDVLEDTQTPIMATSRTLRLPCEGTHC